jgi:hypothetical protein
MKKKILFLATIFAFLSLNTRTVPAKTAAVGAGVGITLALYKLLNASPVIAPSTTATAIIHLEDLKPEEQRQEKQENLAMSTIFGLIGSFLVYDYLK